MNKLHNNLRKMKFRELNIDGNEAEYFNLSAYIYTDEDDIKFIVHDEGFIENDNCIFTLKVFSKCENDIMAIKLIYEAIAKLGLSLYYNILPTKTSRYCINNTKGCVMIFKMSEKSL